MPAASVPPSSPSATGRPDPDRLLAQIQAQAASAHRGKLTLFFGASAGVGKTYAMLSAAQREQAAGRQVLVGVVETHGRSETAALLESLTVLPRQTLVYGERTLTEFDLDGALAAQPELLLVDELAHSNVSGSRHLKRWQDVEELLEAGIDVYTTLNVQHLDSLNDIVGQVTGITVRETVPDQVFDQADEVVLVDLPPDELLTRLAQGKVYLPAQAQRASQHFFRKGNLIALRELALRRTAQRVDAQMRDYRQLEQIAPIWNTAERLVVGIGARGESDRLIRHAARLAKSLHAQWFAVHVETPQLQRQHAAVRQRVVEQLRLAEQMGAEVHTRTAASVVEGLQQFAQDYNIQRLLLGHRPARWGGWQPSLSEQFSLQAAHLDLILVSQHVPAAAPAPVTPASVVRSELWTPHSQRGYAAAVMGCAVVSGLLFQLGHWLDLANVVMLYLLVVVVSVRFGRWPGMLAALVGVLSFDFVFVPPRWSFSVSDTQYLLTFGVMLSVAWVIAYLSANLHVTAQTAAQREQQAVSVSRLAQSLSGALTTQQIVQLTQQWLATHLQVQAGLMLLDAQDRLTWATPNMSMPLFDPVIAQWVYDHEAPAGHGTHTLNAAPLLYRPLRAPMRVRGVIGLSCTPIERLIEPEIQRLLDTVLAQVALALERVHFVEVAQQATVRIEAERLRSTLLSALSHDLRTPVTALGAMASRLQQPELSPTDRHEIASAIEQQAGSIQSLVINLLDLAKLQSGGLHLHQQWLPPEELIGAVLQQLQPRLATHPVDIQLDPALPLIHMDEQILARILTNLLDNAIKYTPAGTPITLSTHAQPDGHASLWVSDTGPGIAADLQERIFERFTRGQAEAAETGLGLGLALCREMIHSLGGELTVENLQPHGARFKLSWPQPPQPQPFEEPLPSPQPLPMNPEPIDMESRP